MKYDKPEVVVLGFAIQAVQGPNKDDAPADGDPVIGSVASYAADE
jgi:hypothetical protein